MKFAFNDEDQLYWFNVFLDLCFDQCGTDCDRDALVLGAFKAFTYSENLLAMARKRPITFTFSEDEETLLTVCYENDLNSYYYEVIKHLTPSKIIQYGYTNKQFKPKIKMI